MMNFRYAKLAAFIVSICILVTLVACGKSDNNTSDNSNNTTNNTADTSTAQTNTDSAEIFDPMAKYGEIVELTAVRWADTNLKFNEGESFDNNIYTRAWESELGIRVKNLWVAPKAEYDQKLSISIASGDLPDIIWANSKHLTSIVDNGMAYDLTDIYDKYATNLTKEILSQDQTCFDTAKRNGKLMAIPNPSSSMDACPMIFYRSDWAKNLGIPEPKTMQDLIAMADAFTNKDPDGNGQKDTIGLAFNKEFVKDTNNTLYGLSGFFAGYHAYPKVWVEDSSGQLVYGSIQPEVKTALKQLQDMYKAGIVDKEFGVKDVAKVGEAVAAGKVGIIFGPMWAPLDAMGKTVDNISGADWMPIPLVSVDDKVAMPNTAINVEKYHIVNSNCKHPEALVKLLNFFMEKNFGETADIAYGTDKDGLQTFQYTIIGASPVRKNLTAHEKILEAVEKNDASKLNVEEKGYYDKIVAFNGGDKGSANWGFTRVFFTPSSFDVIGKYVGENIMLYDGFYGAPTDTMAEKKATLEQLEDQVFTNIIMGQSVDSFDKFVEDWKKLGGDQITKEVNEWAAKNK
ncbi:MAG TPA: extracellular solute-binding protein [Clostridiaceae bacterium]|nr:extracellular solute-binding protein [Clostridiaceae bacterium]